MRNRHAKEFCSPGALTWISHRLFIVQSSLLEPDRQGKSDASKRRAKSCTGTKWSRQPQSKKLLSGKTKMLLFCGLALWITCFFSERPWLWKIFGHLSLQLYIFTSRYYRLTRSFSCQTKWDISKSRSQLALCRKSPRNSTRRWGKCNSGWTQEY